MVLFGKEIFKKQLIIRFIKMKKIIYIMLLCPAFAFSQEWSTIKNNTYLDFVKQGDSISLNNQFVLDNSIDTIYNLNDTTFYTLKDSSTFYTLSNSVANDTVNLSNVGEVNTLPHTQQTTIAQGATLRCFDGVNWEADVVEGFSNANTGTFITPWRLSVDVGNGAGQQQTFIQNVSGSSKVGSYTAKYKRIYDNVTDSREQVFYNLANGAYREIWGNNTLSMNNHGDTETMHLYWANSLNDMSVGNYQEFLITAILGPSYQNNYFRVQRIK